MATARAPVILLVDDEPDLRTIARMSLQHLGGFAVVEAASGAEALELAARLTPSLVLLDVMMPGTDGTDVFRALRANPATRALPVIFLTAKAMPSELDRLREMGAHAIITKPFEPAALVALVRRLLEARESAMAAGADADTNPANVLPSIDVDAEALRDLWGLPGETQADLLGELIDLFATNTPVVLRTLRDEAVTGVSREAQRLAHSLKSSAATLGARGIADLARTIETLAGEGRTAEMPPFLDEIDARLRPAIGRLRAERARLVGGGDATST